MSNQTLKYFASALDDTRRLNPKEKSILIFRLRGKKLEQIAKKFKVTDERIRQLEQTALFKLARKTFQEKLF